MRNCSDHRKFVNTSPGIFGFFLSIVDEINNLCKMFNELKYIARMLIYGVLYRIQCVNSLVMLVTGYRIIKSKDDFNSSPISWRRCYYVHEYPTPIVKYQM